jgi:transmembrane sensor
VQTPDQLEVQVLGTEFMVFSRGRGSKVVLTKGSVQLRQTANPATAPVTIAPGDVATLTTNGRLVLKHHQPVAPFAAWKEHRFVFENTSLVEISRQLNDQFGVRITLSDSTLAQRTLGGTFRAETAADILQVLTDLLDVRVQRTGNQPETYELTPSRH